MVKFDAIATILLGALLGYAHVSGVSAKLLAAFFEPFVVFSSIVLIIVGLCLLFKGTSRHDNWVYLISVIVLCVIYFLTPTSYGESVIESKGLTTSLPSPESFPYTPPNVTFNYSGEALEVEIGDIIMYGQEEEFKNTYENQVIFIVGQYYEGEDINMTGQYVVKFYMFCCAADAQIFAVKLSNLSSPPKSMDWIKATGVLIFNNGEPELLNVSYTSLQEQIQIAERQN